MTVAFVAVMGAGFLIWMWATVDRIRLVCEMRRREKTFFDGRA